MNMNEYYQTNNYSIQRDKMTWAVQTLILINIAVFVIQLLLNIPLGSKGYIIGGKFLSFFLSFQGNLFFRGFIWQPLTYMFLHGGLQHLFFNMLWLFAFGRDVERTLGTSQFIRFYLICGVVGVLFTTYPFLGYAIQRLAGTSDLVIPLLSPVVGASGAVMGIVVAFAVIDPERQLFLFPLPFPIYARTLVIIVIVWNLVSALQGGGISVATHFGGLITGLAYMKITPRLRQRRISKHRKKVDDSVGDAIDNIFEFKNKK